MPAWGEGVPPYENVHASSRDIRRNPVQNNPQDSGLTGNPLPAKRLRMETMDEVHLKNTKDLAQARAYDRTIIRTI